MLSDSHRCVPFANARSHAVAGSSLFLTVSACNPLLTHYGMGRAASNIDTCNTRKPPRRERKTASADEERVM